VACTTLEGRLLKDIDVSVIQVHLLDTLETLPCSCSAQYLILEQCLISCDQLLLGALMCLRGARRTLEPERLLIIREVSRRSICFGIAQILLVHLLVLSCIMVSRGLIRIFNEHAGL
jgi:hypothetical protein